MFKEFFENNRYLLQHLYAILIVILIPSALVINTVYLIKNFQRDMDFELNNKALLVESVIAFNIKDSLREDPIVVKSMLDELVQKLPEVRAIEIFRIEDQQNLSFTTTSSLTNMVFDPVLNTLAFSSDKAFSKEINASLGNNPMERMWLVASPLTDSSGKKVGVINAYVSAAQIDAITQRTAFDSLKVLLITLVIILLLLINHFSLFERAVAFIKLKEIDHLKDDFISIAAHELKTPLTVISSYAFMLMNTQELKTSVDVQDKLNKIILSTTRLGTLVGDILDVTRIEMNRLNLEISVQDLSPIIQEVVDQMLPQATDKKLALTFIKPTEQILVKADKNKLVQVLINVVGNAIKYTLEGSVTLHVETTKKNVSILVKDTGVGIPPSKVNRLFDKFSRIYNEKTKNVPGSGLGLWITKQLIEKMGGKIYVESIENTGTQFTVMLDRQ
ncbi:HAMP domain-containing histidine kinase [Candidatus Woesebacteria bacterium]|nr:HAMP domain-containing histidine kinase [Candidatus Woesebacteria bacterium]